MEQSPWRERSSRRGPASSRGQRPCSGRRHPAKGRRAASRARSDRPRRTGPGRIWQTDIRPPRWARAAPGSRSRHRRSTAEFPGRPRRRSRRWDRRRRCGCGCFRWRSARCSSSGWSAPKRKERARRSWPREGTGREPAVNAASPPPQYLSQRRAIPMPGRRRPNHCSKRIHEPDPDPGGGRNRPIPATPAGGLPARCRPERPRSTDPNRRPARRDCGRCVARASRPCPPRAAGRFRPTRLRPLRPRRRAKG